MAKKIDLRHADLSDCKSRVSPYFEIGEMIGDLEVVDNIERRPQGDKYRIQVRCTACNGLVYWSRVNNLRSGRNQRCLDCNHTEFQRRSLPEPVFAMDCAGDLHNIAGVSNKNHELNAIYNRCKTAQQRCEDSQHPSYHRYGGRGIRFGFNDSMAMLAYIIGLDGFTRVTEDGLSIDRIDNNGDYAPDNLRWASKKTQMANRRNTKFVDLENGQRVTRVQAVNAIHRFTGHDRGSLYEAFRRGKTFTEALEFAQRAAQRAAGERVDEHE